ncbi:MAG TPA: conjugal transfer protein TraI [Chitinophagaceae bacterium]|nr:conjugal transfer protein TraI [Chitinophagaceae bacterium]
MKRLLITVCLISAAIVFPTHPSRAQIPVLEIIKEGITKVIVAVDLKIQRLQNEVIWLQNAQKVLENKFSELKLAEISDWIEKQRAQYANYFDELWRIKAALSYYQRVKDIIEKQLKLVKEYKAAWALFKQDKNFTGDELDHMQKVYQGIMNESIKNLDQLSLVINAFVTQMSDAKRMEIINEVDNKLDENLGDLREFNNQNKMISIQRASEKGDIETVKKLYGL